jgi:hypothetical protein
VEAQVRAALNAHVKIGKDEAEKRKRKRSISKWEHLLSFAMLAVQSRRLKYHQAQAADH